MPALRWLRPGFAQAVDELEIRICHAVLCSVALIIEHAVHRFTIKDDDDLASPGHQSQLGRTSAVASAAAGTNPSG